MKATAFAPGHISGFFEPVYFEQDLSRTGSRGAGINVSLGAFSEVSIVDDSKKQNIEIYVNGLKSNFPVIRLALKYLVGNSPYHIVVKNKTELPISQGFGMSGSSALSATFALAKILGMPQNDALRAAHFAEVQLRTGLGDVMASCFGGIEIRKEPGLPPWGLIEHIPGDYNLVLAVIGKTIDTKKVLNNKKMAINISNYGKYCTKKLLENPSIENLFSLSNLFAEKTKIADKKVLGAIEKVKQFGMASMCMLGNSIFAVGQTRQLVQVLSDFAEVYVCNVDLYGARFLDK